METVIELWSMLREFPSITASLHPELMGMRLIQRVAGATLTASSG